MVIDAHHFIHLDDLFAGDLLGCWKARIGVVKQAYQLRDALVGYYTPYKVGDDDARFLQPDAVIGSFSELKQIL